MKNNYYVYIYYRLDTNEPFYIGKGKNDRWRDLDRKKYNKHFVNIINKHDIMVEIVKDNLTEKQAHDIECWLINELVFEYGFSIDIPNNRDESHYCHLVNQTWGGEGSSGRILSEKERKKQSERMKGKYIGDKNPMYGKNYRDYMTKDALKEHDRKISEANKGNNPLKNMNKKEIEEWKEKIGKANSGENSSRARKIICITTGQIFNTIKDAGEFYNLKPNNICMCCRNENNKYIGHLEDGTPLIWMYLEDYNNATDKEIEIKLNNVNIRQKVVLKGFENPNSKTIICLTTKRIFFTIKEASTYYKCDRTGISRCCKGKQKSAGKLSDGTKLIWRYLIWKHDKKYRIKF